MKKIISLLLILSLLLAFTGCLDNGKEPVETQTNTNSETPSVQQNTEKAPDAAYLNGTKLSEYSIVYGKNDVDYSQRAAEYIKSEIKERTGLELSVNNDTSEKKANEIVVGETTRRISEKLDANTQKTQFALLADSGSVALEGDYFVIAAAAYFFVETYITGEKFESNVPTTETVCEPIVAEKANNYILLIGDGMGLYQTKLFDIFNVKDNLPANYSDGEKTFYGYMLQSQGFARTNSLSGTTDSAASATALSSGYKTINGYVGQNKYKQDIKSFTELAASLGKSTAVMSTEASTGATPGGFSAHVSDRNDSSGILADQAKLKNDIGTIIECNYNVYDEMGVRHIQRKVNNTLKTLSENEKGFFMMYEEAYIDKHCHSNNATEAFHTLVRFNQVIGIVMEYAFYNPDTLVIITADHETGNLLPNSNGSFTYGSGSHSSQYVPVFAHGAGAELFNGKTVENTQIPKTVAKLWGVADFGDQNDSYKPLG